MRSEQGRELAKEDGDGLPFGLYLLAASLVAIASVRLISLGPVNMNASMFVE